jgi:hypothetical protein
VTRARAQVFFSSPLRCSVFNALSFLQCSTQFSSVSIIPPVLHTIFFCQYYSSSAPYNFLLSVSFHQCSLLSFPCQYHSTNPPHSVSPVSMIPPMLHTQSSPVSIIPPMLHTQFSPVSMIPPMLHTQFCPVSMIPPMLHTQFCPVSIIPPMLHTQFSPVSIIQPMLHTNLHLNTTPIRKAKGRRQGTLKLESGVSKIRKEWDIP